MPEKPKHKPSDIVTVNGVTQSIAKFAKDLGTPVQTILSRLKRDTWDVQTACSKPVTAAAKNRGKKSDKDVLNVNEVSNLLAAGRKSETAVRDRVLLVVAYRAGLRCCELLSLLPKDLDQSRGTISVRHGKGDKARIVALDAEAWIAVNEWLQLRSSWFDGTVLIDVPVFCTRKGTELDSRQVRAMVQRRAKNAGIEKHAHAHGLRRTMASELSAEGVDLLDIAAILGHENATTTNTYLKQINPASALDAMRARTWGSSAASSNPTIGSSKLPPPDWITRLKADIGPDRLHHFSDARTSETNFKAVVLLYS